MDINVNKHEKKTLKLPVQIKTLQPENIIIIAYFNNKWNTNNLATS